MSPLIPKIKKTTKLRITVPRAIKKFVKSKKMAITSRSTGAAIAPHLLFFLIARPG
jgi:hypothetical protein